MDSDDEREYQEICRQEKIRMDARFKEAAEKHLKQRLSDNADREHSQASSRGTSERSRDRISVRSPGTPTEPQNVISTIETSCQTGKSSATSSQNCNTGEDPSRDSQIARGIQAIKGIEKIWNHVPSWCPQTPDSYILLEAIRQTARAGYGEQDVIHLASRNMIARLKQGAGGSSKTRMYSAKDFKNIVTQNMTSTSYEKVSKAEATEHGFHLNEHGYLEDDPSIKSRIQHPNDAQNAASRTHRETQARSTSGEVEMGSGNAISDTSLSDLARKRPANSLGENDLRQEVKRHTTTHHADPTMQISAQILPIRPTHMKIPKIGAAHQTSSAFIDSRRAGAAAKLQASSGFKTPGQSFTALTNTPATLTPSTTSVFRYPERCQTPGWYSRATGDVSDRNLIIALQKVKAEIKDSLDSRGNSSSQESHFNEIRVLLHSYEHLQGINQAIMKRSRLLEKTGGLPELFLERIDGYTFPFDITADAKALYNKWARTDFDPDIMRGIVQKKTNRISNSIDKDYPYRLNSNYFGNGDLVSGQWWPLQICALRDGAHGEMQAGISCWTDKGTPVGATSVVLSHSKEYDDVDNGETMWYTGTKGFMGKMTEDTRYMRLNLKKGNPVRVLRSSKLGEKNRYRPSSGIRFDGSYDVVAEELLDAGTFHYRFKLERKSDQDPIRYKGIGARPTAQDELAYNKHKMLSG